MPDHGFLSLNLEQLKFTHVLLWMGSRGLMWEPYAGEAPRGLLLPWGAAGRPPPSLSAPPSPLPTEDRHQGDPEAHLPGGPLGFPGHGMDPSANTEKPLWGVEEEARPLGPGPLQGPLSQACAGREKGRAAGWPRGGSRTLCKPPGPAGSMALPEARAAAAAHVREDVFLAHLMDGQVRHLPLNHIHFIFSPRLHRLIDSFEPVIYK